MGTQRNPLRHLRKSVTIRESNHASGVYKEHGRITKYQKAPFCSQELVTNFFYEKVGVCICQHRQGL